MGVESSLKAEFVKQWIDKRGRYRRREDSAVRTDKFAIVIAFSLKRGSTSHLPATGDGMGPAEQCTIAKTVLAVGCTLQARGI